MHRLVAAADSAILVELDAGIGEAGAAVLGLEAALRSAAIPGLIETVPGLRSLMVEYDCLRTSHGEMAAAIAAVLQAAPPQRSVGLGPGRRVVLPLCCDAELGVDLAEVAASCGLPRDGVIARLCAVEHRVALLGNLPGLPYLVGLPAELTLARRTEPRTAVPAGSVAVADGMTCIYPVSAPGGWHVVGATGAVLFDAEREPPCLLAPGDRVRFELVPRSRLGR